MSCGRLRVCRRQLRATQQVLEQGVRTEGISHGRHPQASDPCSPSGKVFLRQDAPAGASIVDRSWFNIGDDLAYRLTLEVRGGRVKAAWRNMLSLEGPVGAGAGRFGVFVERGVMYVTDLVLESLT